MARSEKKPYGPYALRYFSRITLELARIRTDEDKLYIQATVAKNKQGGGNQKCEYIMLNGKGLGPEFDILFLAMEYDIIQKAGAWYEYNGQKAQGMDNCVLTYDMKQIALEVDKRIREDLNGRS
jgi:recombination protein RecA